MRMESIIYPDENFDDRKCDWCGRSVKYAYVYIKDDNRLNLKRIHIHCFKEIKQAFHTATVYCKPFTQEDRDLLFSPKFSEYKEKYPEYGNITGMPEMCDVCFFNESDPMFLCSLKDEPIDYYEEGHEVDNDKIRYPRRCPLRELKYWEFGNNPFSTPKIEKKPTVDTPDW